MKNRPAHHAPASHFAQAVRAGQRNARAVRALRLFFALLLIGGTALWRQRASADVTPGADSTAASAAIGVVVTQTTNVNPVTLPAGASTTIITTVSDQGSTLLNGIIDIEVHDVSNQKVGQQYWVGQTIKKNQSVSRSYTWTAQAAGTYQVAVGVYGANWAPTYLWNANAAAISVAAQISTATATATAVPPTSTSTPLPPTSTSTSTAVPPSSTTTNTAVPPTGTSTPVPPSATGTAPAGGASTATRTPVPPTATATRSSGALSALHVSGTQLLNAANQPVVLRGVNRSGTEYACIQGWGIFDGPNVTNDDSQVPLMKQWGANEANIGINEDCWLGINGVSATYGGQNYINAIVHETQTLESYGLYPVISLFWEAPGTSQATGQIAMPDNDHAPAFWRSVASTFKGDPRVILRLKEEPYPAGNTDGAAAWQCWSKGDVQYNSANTLVPVSQTGNCSEGYKTVGMQSLVNIIRGTGATNVIQVPGVEYANDMTQFLNTSFRVSDTLANPQLMGVVDVYPNGNTCNSSSCYNAEYAPVIATMPFLAGEIGESVDGSDCTTGLVDTLVSWLDSHGAGYGGWDWDTWGGCLQLIASYSTGAPNGNWGKDYQAHLLSLAGSAASPTPTSTTAAGTSSTSTQTPAPATATNTAVPPGSTNTPVPPTATATSASAGGTPYVLYDNAVENGWQDAPFSYSSHNPCDSSVYNSAPCSYAIAYTAWGGIQLVAPSAFSLASYATLDYYLNPNGLPIVDFSALLLDTSGQVITELVLGAANDLGAQANGFHHISVPLNQLDPAGVAISAVQLKNATGGSLATIHVDDVRFLSSGSRAGAATATPPTATAPPGSTATASPTSPPASGLVAWSAGYYTGWQQASYPPQMIPWSAITHLIQFSVMTSPNRDGSIDTTAHGLTPAFMQAAVAAAHAAHRQILLSIGGAEDNNWDAACSATNRATFINNLVGLMQQYGYDGIDLDIEQDWQSPTHPDYIACVSGIRSALNQITPRPLLTEAADPDWQAYMLVQVYQYLDQINLMSYTDAATTIASKLANYTSLGIPKTMLGVGIGIDDGGVDGSNPADCPAKAQYVANNGYGGVMEWDVAADSILHAGQTPCFNGIAPYVPPAPSAPPTVTNTPVPPAVTGTATPAPPTATSTPTAVPPTPTITTTPVPAGTVNALPLISRGVPAYTNDDCGGSYPATNANNADYNDFWRSCNGSPSSTSPKWLAYDLSSKHPGKAVVAWYNDSMSGDYNTTVNQSYYNLPAAYTLDANAAPGGGAPPSSGWVTLASVTGNVYASRQHLVDLSGYNWLRIDVTASLGQAGNQDAALNLDVQSAPNGASDDWIMFGDSITAGALAHGEGAPDTAGSFAQMVQAGNASFYPVQQDGGIGYLTSASGAADVPGWLPLFYGHFVGLAYGTNDALGGCDSAALTNFYNNYVTMVKAVIAAGDVPVIPTIPFGSESSLQSCVPAYNQQLAALEAAYPQILPGPDLYTYFKNNPSLISSDGIHPSTPAGMDAERQQWATWALTRVY